MDYVVVVQAPAYRVSDDTFLTESAFAWHLVELRRMWADKFDRLVLVAPALARSAFEERRRQLTEVNERETGVYFVETHTTDLSRPRFLLFHLPRVWRLLARVISTAGVVQSGMSTQLGHPIMAMANFAALRVGVPVVFMVDIDFRRHSERLFKTGLWSLKSYVVNRLLYDPLKWLQVRLAPYYCQLVMLKSMTMVRDFGRGAANVVNFYDTAHSAEHVLTDAASREKARAALERSVPLRLVYFGRLASNKGVERMVSAVALARANGVDCELLVIGEGECLPALHQQVQREELDDFVRFEPPKPYGPPLFDLLSGVHVCLAAPLIEDTPRAAFDAMARGLPVIAFDITYFRDLAQASGAVLCSPWPQAGGLAEGITRLARDRDELAAMVIRAVDFARQNTQEFWLRRRRDFIEEALSARTLR